MRTNKAASAVRFVRTRAPVWALRLRYGLHARYGQNAISRRKLHAQRPLLTPVQRRVVEDLQTHGVASVVLTELGMASEPWSQLSAIVDAFARTLIKAYLYFSDVHEGAGPMEYVPGSASAGTGDVPGTVAVEAPRRSLSP